MPETVAAVSAAAQAVSAALATTYAGISVGTYLAVATAIYGTVQQRRSARKVAAAARDAYNAGLTDRTVNIISADNPWQVIYGAATVGCAAVALLTSGDRDQFKHLVVVWAAHECQAIDDLLLNGESIGPLDAAGYVQPGSHWYRSDTVTQYEELAVSGSGTLTLAHPANRVVSVAYSTNPGDAQITYVLEDPALVSIAANVLTLPAPYATDWASFTVGVTYEWTREMPMVRARHHLGTSTQAADADLIAAAPGEWTSTDRGLNLTYSWIEFNLNETELWGGPPQCTAAIRGKKLYDPRLDSTQPGGSGAHRSEDPSTWAYSSNSALCTTDFIRADFGKGAATRHVQWPSVQASANACDTAATYGALTQALYTCNGSFRTDAEPDVTLDQLCQSMAGFATYMGSWYLQAGVYTAPVMALTDADNMGPIDLVPAAPLHETMNGLRGRFYDPARFDQVTDYTPYKNTGFVTADGAEMWENLDLPFTNTALRAHQLCRVQVERSRGMALVYPAKMRAVRLKPGQRVTLTNSLFGLTAAVFRVVKREYTPGSAVNLALVQDDPGHYDLVDAPSPVSVPTVSEVDPYRVSLVTSITAATGGAALARDLDGNVITRVTLSYAASVDALVLRGGGLNLEYRLHDQAEWQRQPDATADSTSVQVRGLQENRLYVFRLRWFNAVGAVGDWRSVAALTDAVARPAPDIYTASAAGPVAYSNVI